MAAELDAPPAALIEDGLRYRYPPLRGRSSVRILSLEPGAGDEPLVGSLAHERLTAGPDFEAISYMWGSGARDATILCDGRLLPLTRSVHDALRRMRLPAGPRRLWADQVCIDQENIAERSEQVNLMNQIFKGARRVLVWLGPDHEGAARAAVAMVHRLNDIFADDEKHAAFLLAHEDGLQQQDEDAWVPLSKLTGLPWFGRIWIVQEIGTTTPATLHWGDEELDWELLSRVCSVLTQKYHHLRTRFRILTPGITYLYRRFVDPEADDGECPDGQITMRHTNFMYQLNRARHLLARDPRDHVYAFLGHPSKHNSENKALAEIQADYSRPVQDVFYDLAVRELGGAESLQMLSACHEEPILARRKKTTPLDLPSWVPDWRRSPLHMLCSPSSPHRASGDSRPRLRIDAARRRLHIRGVRLDRVARTSWTFYGNAFQFRHGPLSRPPIDVLWRDTCGHGDDSQIGLEHRYVVNGDAAFFALIQTLTDAGAHTGVPAELWLANGAAYLVRALRRAAPARVTPELRRIAAAGDAFKWSYKATLVTRYRRFAVTSAKGLYAIGPPDIEPDDVVVVLYGGKMPIILRQVPSDNEQGQGAGEGVAWKLIGECYVHGVMAGEALAWGGVEDEEFVIV